MKLGFDIDDCITKTTETFCKVGNQLFNLNLEPNLLNSNSVKFEDIGLVTYEQVVKIKEKYHESHIFRNIEPHDKAIESLLKLKSKTIYFITSRNDYVTNELEEDTNYWFKKNEICNYKLIFTNDKQSIINQLKLDIYIEDNISQIQNLQNIKNLQIIMPRRPWNEKFSTFFDNVETVNDWKEIIQKINNYDKKN